MLPFFDPVERDISEYDGEINPLPELFSVIYMKKAFLLTLSLALSNVYAVEDNLILEEKFPKKLSDFSFFTDDKAQVPSQE